MKTSRKTALSFEHDGVSHIRGYALTELLKKYTFGQAIFLLLKGELPNDQQAKVFEGVLVAAIDHGPLAPSSDIARRTASNGVPVNAAVAAGVASIGDSHGGAIEQAGQLFQSVLQDQSVATDTKGEEVVRQGLANFKRLPGFGHRVYETDPRVEPVFELLKTSGLSTVCAALARSTEAALEKTKGKKICLNIDGAMAAILTDLGFPWSSFRGLFIIARTPGLVAQALEQIDREPPVLRSQDELEYDGTPRRDLP